MLETANLRETILKHLLWKEGDGDLWGLYRHPDDFAAVLDKLFEPFQAQEPTAVVGVESRGFFLGGALAQRYGLAFVPIRKRDSLLIGEKVVRRTAPDYRGLSHTLRMQSFALSSADRVIIVDDWYETGSQGLAAGTLVGDTGATLLGHTVIVDQLAKEMRQKLGTVHSVLTADDLPGHENCCGPSEATSPFAGDATSLPGGR